MTETVTRPNELTSLPMTAVTFALLTSHRHVRNDSFRTAVLDLLVEARLEGVQFGTEPNSDWSPRLRERFEKVAESPYTQWGLMGHDPHPDLVRDLRAYTRILKQRRRDDENLVQTMAVTLADFQSLTYRQPYWRPNPKPAKLFSINRTAGKLAIVNRELLRLAWALRPQKCDLNPIHAEDLQHAYQFCEVTLERQLAHEMRELYVNEIHDFLPWALLYQLTYDAPHGADYALNLSNWATLLGFQGHATQGYRYIARHHDKIGRKLFPSYPYHFDQICRVVDYRDERVTATDGETFEPSSHHTSGFRANVIDDRTVGGVLKGSYIVDRTHVGPGRLLGSFHQRDLLAACYGAVDPRLGQPHFFHVSFLEPRSLFSHAAQFSMFTHHHAALWVYHRAVRRNTVTRPRRSPYERNPQWFPIDDRYLEALSDLDALRLVARDDVQSMKELIAKGLLPNDLTEYEIRTLYWRHVDEAFAVLRGKPVTFKPCKVFEKETAPGKTRLCCDEHPEQKILNRILNRILQTVIQRINLQHFGGRMSNYLKGSSPVIDTMERFRNAVARREIDFANLDVKSCFDNLNVRHTNFAACLRRSLDIVTECVSPGAAKFTDLVMQHLRRLIEIPDQFESDEPLSRYPDPGTLPTGYVLSASTWMLLSLPALLETERSRQAGTILEWDQCGDDLIMVAARSVPTEQKLATVEPWFALGRELDLKFHFFKRYKEQPDIAPPSMAWYFDFSGNEQDARNAWALQFPRYSIPILHGGCALARATLIETVLSEQDQYKQSRVYQAIWKTKQHQSAIFLPLQSVRIKQFGSPDDAIFLGRNDPSLKDEVTIARGRTELIDILYGVKVPAARLCEREKAPAPPLRLREKPGAPLREVAQQQGRYFIYDPALTPSRAQPPSFDSTATPKALPDNLESLKVQMRGYAKAYDDLWRAFAKADVKVVRDGIAKRAWEMLVRHGYLVCLTRPDIPIDPEAYMEFFAEPLDEYKKRRLTMEEELFFVLKDFWGSQGNLLRTLNEFLTGKRNLKGVYRDNERRIACLLPYLLLVESRGPSFKVTTLLEALKAGKSLMPTARVYWDEDGKRTVTKGELEVFTEGYDPLKDIERRAAFQGDAEAVPAVRRILMARVRDMKRQEAMYRVGARGQGGDSERAKGALRG